MPRTLLKVLRGALDSPPESPLDKVSYLNYKRKYPTARLASCRVVESQLMSCQKLATQFRCARAMPLGRSLM
ncbi:hypothetical protein L484_011359 [Morus notabilis]|uniref:Uncharacterized protein n=1 Tax=Morus notabilis TaxID=981085 RepID=W9SIT3_9ROSA|nr:hypothetical protein L484_011359 [Morus notabilis]